jgi:phospholipase C
LLIIAQPTATFGVDSRSSAATRAIIGAAGSGRRRDRTYLASMKTIKMVWIATLATAGLGCGGDEAAPTPSAELGALAAAPTVAPEASGIEHVVVVMMENRSFDHLLGWTPGADGKQAGLTYTDAAGQSHPTHALAPDFQGCGHPDPDHSFEGGRVEYDQGASDGWLRAGSNDDFSIGYYEQSDLGFLGRAVPQWTTMDRYFAGTMAETFPNRIYQHAAQTDRLTNTLDLSVLPTIWDRLAEKGLDGRYYFSDVPFLALWGAKYLAISRPFAAFLADAQTGDLPQVAFVDPRFIDEQSGTSGDDHPHSDIRNGEAFLDLIYKAVTTGPAWEHTVLVINFDEWGGFFDHVPPPTAPIPAADAAAGNTDGRLGFRAANLLVAPWARGGFVSHVQFDHTSVLRMIEWRWGLEPLTVRDATANNLAAALNFNARRRRAPPIAVAPGPFGAPCVTAALAPVGREIGLGDLAAVAKVSGWQLP